MLWSRGIARARLMGYEPTHNPSPAAAALLKRGLGKRKRLAAVVRALSRRRRPFHRGNPPPAVVALAAYGKKLLGGRFRTPSEKRAEPVAQQLVTAAVGGNLTAAKAIIERTQIGIAKERAVWNAALAQLPPELMKAVTRYKAQIPGVDHTSPEAAGSSALSRPFNVPGSGAGLSPGSTEGPTLLGVLQQPGTIRAIGAVARSSTRRRRRQRYPTYSDRYGRQRYSYKPPGSEMRIPEGAIPTPGTPYSFFRGAVGAGGALATAGQLAVGAGAGLASYLVTRRLLAVLGGRAQAKEEAGVNAALAFRQARADFAAQQGRAPNRAELAEMKSAYQQQLVALGYDPVTFTRSRSGVESFLETYNPLGG